MMEGVFSGDPHDVADGFIHLSAADQVEGTLVKHYNEHERLLLVEIDLEALGDTVKWEKSRGGALFPHLYRRLRRADVLWAKPLPLGPRGHVFPAEMV